MTAEYRIVHFAPDPFDGARWPIGAIVRFGGELHGVRARRLPTAAGLGSTERATVAEWMANGLGRLTSFDRTPLALGPCALLDRPTPVPTGVTDPIQWLQDHVLPRESAPTAQKRPSHPDRAQMGRSFFNTWNVGQWVRHDFLPDRDWDARLASHAGRLDKVSHWSSGGDGILLMEAVSPGSTIRDADLRHLATRGRAYRAVLDSSESTVAAEFITLLLAGGQVRDRLRLHSALEGNVHRVVDTTEAGPRSRLLEQIREMGADAMRQGLLPFG